MATMKYIVNSV